MIDHAQAIDESLPAKAAAAWDAASPASRDKAVNQALVMMGRMFVFPGSPATPGQTTPWPRNAATRSDGTPIVGIPREMDEATRLMAGVLLGELKLDISVLSWMYRILAPICQR